MKRLKYLILSFILGILSITNVFASGNVEISNIELDSKSTTTVINNQVSADNLNINSDVSFLNVGDYVTYKITLKNNSNKDYEIPNNISNDNKYVSYSLDIDNNIKAGEEITGYITIKYNKLCNDYDKGTLSFEENLKVNLSISESNPKTGSNVVPYIIFLIGASVSLIVIVIITKKYKNKNIITPIIIIGIVSILGVYKVNALESVNITINSKVTLYDDKNNDDIADTYQYVSITYKAGDNGTINGKSSYTTDKIYLPGYSTYPKAPSVIADNNYKFKEWTPNYVVGEIIDKDNPVIIYTATYYEDKNDNNIDDSTELVSITFDAGDHGTINGNSSYVTEKTYLPGTSAYPEAPSVTANANYKFKEWTPNYTAGSKLSLTSPTLTFKATYYEDKNNNNVDDSTELVSIIFEAGDHGTINGNSSLVTAKTYLPGYSNYPEAPSVTANSGYKFKEWTPSYVKGNVIDKDSITYTATYYEDKNNNDIDDSTELVSITYNAGDHGNIDGKTSLVTSKTYLPGYSSYPEAPSITAATNYKFKEWTPSYSAGSQLASTNPTITYTATYYEDKNNNNVEDSTELVSLTFYAGLYGNIGGNTTYTTDKIYLPGYSTYPKAPSVTINNNEGYKFDGFGNYSEGTVIPLNSTSYTYTANYSIRYDTGELIKLATDQYFYVIKSDANTTLLFAAYNLNVGDKTNSAVTSGLQDSSIRSYVSATDNDFGSVSYYDTVGVSTSGITKLDSYLTNYANYLQTKCGFAVYDIDLLDRKTAIDALGMGKGTTAFTDDSPYKSWMTNTTFWFKEESNMNGYVYYSNTSNSIGTSNGANAGIRPIIEVSTGSLHNYLTIGYNDLIIDLD